MPPPATANLSAKLDFTAPPLDFTLTALDFSLPELDFSPIALDFTLPEGFFDIGGDRLNFEEP